MPADDPIIKQTLALLEQFKPKSVFLYGSRGRGDNMPDSDYEIGVIFNDNEYVPRAEMHKVVTGQNVKAYPFKWGELSSGAIHFLFQKALYIREITAGAKTLAGEDLVGSIQPLPITTLDLVCDIRFSVARALDALLAYRSGDAKTAIDLFTKSCFYGLRCFEILELNTFPLGYKQIYDLSEKLLSDSDDKAVVERAYKARHYQALPPIDILYDNISLLDSTIEPKLQSALQSRGDVKII